MTRRAYEHLAIVASLVAFFVLCMLCGCTTEPRVYPRGDLAHQILHVRTGYGLSSRTARDTIKYDLADAGIRTQLGVLGFVCKLGGRRFEVCPDQPGFCRYTTTGFWPFRKRHTEFVAITEELRLVQAHTRCFSKRFYDYDTL